MTHHLALDPGLRALGWGFLVLGWCSLLVRVVGFLGRAGRATKKGRSPGP